MAPPAGFNSTIQLPKHHLNKITVLVYLNQRVCLCTHTLVFLTALRLHKRHLFLQDLYPLQHQKTKSTDRRAASASGNEVLPPSFIKKYREA